MREWIWITSDITWDTSHRLEASMMNAETALWDVHPARCPRSRGGRCREGDRGGETVRHSANVTYCLFRGGCTAP